METCEHIQSCKDCGKLICNYCVEVCDGCELEGCEKCYTKHLNQCVECNKLLCKNLIIKYNDKKSTDASIKDICPACHIQKGM